MGHGATKPVFGVSEKMRHILVSSERATGTILKIEVLQVEDLDILLSNK